MKLISRKEAKVFSEKYFLENPIDEELFLKKKADMKVAGYKLFNYKEIPNGAIVTFVNYVKY